MEKFIEEHRKTKKQKRGYHFGRQYAVIDWEKAQLLFKQHPLPAEQTSNISRKDLLLFLAGLGTIGLTFVCPHAGIVIGKLLLGSQEYTPWKVRRTLRTLAKQKDVTVTYHADGSISVRITKQGLTRSLTYKLDMLSISKPKKWDKKWRVIIFDIPIQLNKVRDLFRERLKQLGLVMIQKSVFISPFPCFDEVEFLRQLYHIPDTILYILAEKVEGEERFRQRFNLSG